MIIVSIFIIIKSEFIFEKIKALMKNLNLKLEGKITLILFFCLFLRSSIIKGFFNEFFEFSFWITLITIIFSIGLIALISYILGVGFQLFFNMINGIYVNNKKLNLIMIFLCCISIYLNMFVGDINTKYSDILPIMNMSLVHIVLVGLYYVQSCINIIIIIFGIKKCMIDCKLYELENDKNKIIESKIKVIIIWFLIIWLNTTATIYFTSSMFGSKIIDGINGFVDSGYFALITLLTIGYGKIVPLSKLGKIIVMIYSLINAYLMLIGISSILSLRNQHKNKIKDEDILEDQNEYKISIVKSHSIDSRKYNKQILKRINKLKKEKRKEKNNDFKAEYNKKIKELIRKME